MSQQAEKKEATLIRLTRFRADLGRALHRRGKHLLEADDAAQQMAALAPLEAYLVIKELGIDEALPLLRLTTDEQWQACIDLDCWQGDDLAPAELDAWLAPFAAGGPETLAEAFLRLDEEVQVLHLAGCLHVYDARSEEAPELRLQQSRMTTPDDLFVLHTRRDDDFEVEPFVLVGALYRHDAAEAMRLLMAAKWELTSGLAEQALHFRAGRLEDLGFVSAAAAARLFASPPKNPPPTAELAPPPTHIPALYAAALPDGSLLAAALSGETDPVALERRESELVYLVNAAVVAYGGSPKDLAHTQAVAERVRDTLSLGLEALLQRMGQGSETATQALRPWSLLHVFQHGHACVVPLVRAARDLAHDPVVARWLDSVGTQQDDDPEAADRAFVRNLIGRAPLHAGFVPLRPNTCRAFGSLADLRAAQARLNELAQRLM